MTLCNKSALSWERWRYTILCQAHKIPYRGESTGPYVKRRSKSIQHTTHSGTSPFGSPNCGLCNSHYGFACTWYWLSSYKACGTLHQDLTCELICSSNFTFPNMSLGHIDVHPSIRLLYELMQMEWHTKHYSILQCCKACTKCASSGI